MPSPPVLCVRPVSSHCLSVRAAWTLSRAPLCPLRSPLPPDCSLVSLEENCTPNEGNPSPTEGAGWCVWGCTQMCVCNRESGARELQCAHTVCLNTWTSVMPKRALPIPSSGNTAVVAGESEPPPCVDSAYVPRERLCFGCRWGPARESHRVGGQHLSRV